MKSKLQPHKMGCEGKEDKRYCDCGVDREQYDEAIKELIKEVKLTDGV